MGSNWVAGGGRTRRRPAPPPAATVGPDDANFYPTVHVRCPECASLPHEQPCTQCGAAAFLVHPGTHRGEPVSEHWYACLPCRRERARVDAAAG